MEENIFGKFIKDEEGITVEFEDNIELTDMLIGVAAATNLIQSETGMSVKEILESVNKIIILAEKEELVEKEENEEKGEDENGSK